MVIGFHLYFCTNSSSVQQKSPIRSVVLWNEEASQPSKPKQLSMNMQTTNQVLPADPKEPSAQTQPQSQTTSGLRLEMVDRINPLRPASKNTAPLIQGMVKKDVAIATHSSLHGLSSEKEEAIRRLYDRLDTDNDGTIDIRDLTAALKHEVPHIPAGLAPQILERISKNGGKEVSFTEFIHYVVEHEKRLETIFKDLDRNQDGVIDVREIKNYCNDLGVPISDAKITKVIDQMDRSGSASIDLGDFQHFMLLYPSTDPREIVDFWRHNLVIDIGEDSQIPEDFTETEILQGVWWRHLVAGGMAGCMSRTCTAPLDRLKVFLQVHSNKLTPFNMFTGVNYLYKEGGLKSFWRGNGINVVKIAPESALKFMAYEQIKRMIQRLKGSKELTIYERFIAGSSAGAISQTIIYPLEVLKTRLALRRTGDLDKGLSFFAREMYRKEGLLCFYKGYVPNLIGIIPYAGIDLAVYETLKKMYLKKNPDISEPGVLALLACGTCSSTCGQLTSYPLALIRTRLQARGFETDLSFCKNSNKGIGKLQTNTMNFPSASTPEEKELKEMFEKLRKVRKAIGAAAKNMAGSSTTTAAKVETRVNKKSIQEAEFATAEVKKKIMSGAITVKKANEKQIFKRSHKKKDMNSKPSFNVNELGVNGSGSELITSPKPAEGGPPPRSVGSKRSSTLKHSKDRGGVVEPSQTLSGISTVKRLRTDKNSC